MTQLMKGIIISFSFLAIISCGEVPQATTAKSEVAATKNETIAGRVTAIEYGKDGYTAKVNTLEKGEYAALVSIVNLGGPDHYQQVSINDEVIFSGVPSTLNGENRLMVKKIIKVETARTYLTIDNDAFRGITVGDKISMHTDYIQKEQLRNGEGTFEVYQIKDFNNNPAGYFLPDPKDESRVGDIIVETPKASTAEGIKVSSTFEALSKALPNIEVHGSEIEGRTYANYGNLSYRLDIPNFSYEVDVNKISSTTKVIEILINRWSNSEAMTLNEKYSAIESGEFCWMTNKKMELRAAPGPSAKIEGPHFQGEALKVLGSKIINNQLWVNVEFTLSIKAGYEDQFADGTVMSTGSPKGWIGGEEVPLIRCK